MSATVTGTAASHTASMISVSSGPSIEAPPRRNRRSSIVLNTIADRRARFQRRGPEPGAGHAAIHRLADQLPRGRLGSTARTVAQRQADADSALRYAVHALHV